MRLLLKDGDEICTTATHGICSMLQLYFSSPNLDQFKEWASNGLELWFIAKVLNPPTTQAVLPVTLGCIPAFGQLTTGGLHAFEKRRIHAQVPLKYKQMKWDLAWTYVCILQISEWPLLLASPCWETIIDGSGLLGGGLRKSGQQLEVAHLLLNVGGRSQDHMMSLQQALLLGKEGHAP